MINDPRVRLMKGKIVLKQQDRNLSLEALEGVRGSLLHPYLQCQFLWRKKNCGGYFFRAHFSLEGGGTLNQNRNKPSQDILWEAWM